MAFKRQQKRRKRLFNENPYCHICNVKMILPNGKNSNLKNLCTLEHICSRLNPARTEKWVSKERYIGKTTILCKKCNNDKGNREYNNLPIEELWRRSGKRPHWYNFILKWLKNLQKIW